jgi:hypothetical protein
MNLIDKYITEVGKHLPRKGRADIEAEIRSTLEDMLEERKQVRGLEEETLVIELLREYGEPRKVAESYVGPQYLIGPRLYPFMWMVARIVLSVLFMVLLMIFGFSVVRGQMSSIEIAQALTGFIGNYIGAAISALGNIVLIFAVLERVLPAEVTKDMQEKWDPAQLAREPDPDQVKVGEEVVEIFFTLAFLILFNFFPERIGLYIFSRDELFFIPLLTEAFFRYLHWWTLIGVGQIGLNFLLLSAGTWTKVTRVASLVLKAATIVLVIFILTGPAMIAITPESLAGLEFELSPKKAETLSSFVLIPFFLAILIANGIEAGQTILRLWNTPTREPFPIKP